MLGVRGAATERHYTGLPARLTPGQMDRAPGQAQPANMDFCRVFISLEINNTNDMQNVVISQKYNPLLSFAFDN